MKFTITTNHADYEKLFGGPEITVEFSAGCCIVREAANADLIGEKIEISADGDIAEQLAAMYSGEARKAD